MFFSSKPWRGVVASLAMFAVPPGAQAQPDTDLENLREELAALRQSYEDRIYQLELRLEQLEAAGPAPDAGAADAAAAGAPAAPAPERAAVAQASVFNPAMSVVLTGTYSNLSQDPADYAIAGFFPAATRSARANATSTSVNPRSRCPRASTRTLPRR